MFYINSGRVKKCRTQLSIAELHQISIEVAKRRWTFIQEKISSTLKEFCFSFLYLAGGGQVICQYFFCLKDFTWKNCLWLLF